MGVLRSRVLVSKDVQTPLMVKAISRMLHCETYEPLFENINEYLEESENFNMSLPKQNWFQSIKLAGIGENS